MVNEQTTKKFTFNFRETRQFIDEYKDLSLFLFQDNSTNELEGVNERFKQPIGTSLPLFSNLMINLSCSKFQKTIIEFQHDLLDHLFPEKEKF